MLDAVAFCEREGLFSRFRFARMCQECGRENYFHRGIQLRVMVVGIDFTIHIQFPNSPRYQLRVLRAGRAVFAFPVCQDVSGVREGKLRALHRQLRLGLPTQNRTFAILKKGSALQALFFSYAYRMYFLKKEYLCAY